MMHGTFVCPLIRSSDVSCLNLACVSLHGTWIRTHRWLSIYSYGHVYACTCMHARLSKRQRGKDGPAQRQISFSSRQHEEPSEDIDSYPDVYKQ